MHRLACLAAVLIALCAATPASAERLTVDRLVASPSLDGDKVAKLALAPDGSRVTFLKGKEEDFRRQDLWEYHLADRALRRLVDADTLTTDTALSEVEKARRERQRITATGIVEYSWQPGGAGLLFPLGGDLYYLPLDGDLRRLTDTDAFETDARFSPQGSYVSFIRDQNLFVIELATGVERQLTNDGGGVILNGMAEFVAQEEMRRTTGYWWSPDETRIAFTRVDESPVQLVDRYEVAADGSVTTIAQRYPFAGTDNVRIELGVVAVADAGVRWIDLGLDGDIYLARVNWLPDSLKLAFQRQSRDQKRLELIFADVTTGARRVVLTEDSDTWINLNDDLRFLENSNQFLWASERSGFKHLYLYQRDGTLVSALTEGPWAISALKGVDEAGGWVYFEGFADTPLEKHLYRVPLTGSTPALPLRLTEQGGWHDTVVAGDGSMFIDTFSAEDTPPRVALRRADGRRIAWIVENPLDRRHPYQPFLDHHAPREYGAINTQDGVTLLYQLMRPANFDPQRKYPAVVSVYGGPRAQRVRKGWSVDFNQLLAQSGYVVFTLDNRGAANRGKAFEDVLYRAMGATEVDDQLLGVGFLKGLPFVDPERVGLFGWSYGGYMTLMCMAKAPGAYAAGVSIAPVTDWRLYDTHYTERYLGDPAAGPAYDDSSVFSYVDGLTDPLLVVHGMADDNVFFDHTVRLAAELQERRQRFEMMTYPGKKHGIRGADTRAHLWGQVLEFFDRHLKP